MNRRTPPPQAGEDINAPTLQELSDGLERLMQAEGADIAPDRTDVREDMESVVRAEGPVSNQLLELLAEWNKELEALDAPELKAPKRVRGPEIGP